MSESRPAAPGPAPSDVRVDPSAPLFPHMATLLFVLHLVYEVKWELKWGGGAYLVALGEGEKPLLR